MSDTVTDSGNENESWALKVEPHGNILIDVWNTLEGNITTGVEYPDIRSIFPFVERAADDFYRQATEGVKPDPTEVAMNLATIYLGAYQILNNTPGWETVNLHDFLFITVGKGVFFGRGYDTIKSLPEGHTYLQKILDDVWEVVKTTPEQRDDDYLADILADLSTVALRIMVDIVMLAPVDKEEEKNNG